MNSLRANSKKVEKAEELKIVYETDRIYPDVKEIVCLKDFRNRREFVIERSNLPDVVIWNPDVDKAKEMNDLGDLEYTSFCCVEPGAIFEPCILKANETWFGAQKIRVIQIVES